MKERLFSDSGVGTPRRGGQHDGPGYLPCLKILTACPGKTTVTRVGDSHL